MSGFGKRKQGTKSSAAGTSARFSPLVVRFAPPLLKQSKCQAMFWKGKKRPTKRIHLGMLGRID